MRVGILTLYSPVPSFVGDNENIAQFQRVETWLNKEPHFRSVVYDILTNYKISDIVKLQWYSQIGDTLWYLDGIPIPSGIQKLAMYLEFEINKIINSFFTIGTRFHKANLAN